MADVFLQKYELEMTKDALCRIHRQPSQNVQIKSVTFDLHVFKISLTFAAVTTTKYYALHRPSDF